MVFNQSLEPKGFSAIELILTISLTSIFLYTILKLQNDLTRSTRSSDAFLAVINEIEKIKAYLSVPDICKLNFAKTTLSISNPLPVHFSKLNSKQSIITEVGKKLTAGVTVTNISLNDLMNVNGNLYTLNLTIEFENSNSLGPKNVIKEAQLDVEAINTGVEIEISKCSINQNKVQQTSIPASNNPISDLQRPCLILGGVWNAGLNSCVGIPTQAPSAAQIPPGAECGRYRNNENLATSTKEPHLSASNKPDFDNPCLGFSLGSLYPSPTGGVSRCPVQFKFVHQSVGGGKAEAKCIKI